MSTFQEENTAHSNVAAAHALNVVVVEDHDGLREVVVEVLRSQGHAAVGLSCTEELEDKAGGTPIDLLIVDLNLPGEDGLSLVSRVRLAQPMAGIVIISARETVDDRVRGYASGADVYLQKPVSMVELVAAINSISRRLGAQTQARGTTPAAPVQVDIGQMRVHGPLGKSQLSDSEASLLSVLARAPGRRIDTAAQLAHLAMDPGARGKSALEVRVVRLRRKLVAVGADKLCLRSTRMRGYQLSVAINVH